MSVPKLEIYRQLVDLRKQCTVCRGLGLINPSTCENGIFDSDQLGPWSRWQGNLNAKMMVVGQDWSDEKFFVTHQGREKPGNPTNKVLGELLATVGIKIDTPAHQRGLAGEVFFTNAVLCLKQGGLQGPVSSTWFENCGSRFLKPTIDLVQPRVVVTLGVRAYHAVTQAYRIEKVPFRSAVAQSFSLPTTQATLFPVYHCGSRILNTHRKRHEQIKDWNRIRLALAALS